MTNSKQCLHCTGWVKDNVLPITCQDRIELFYKGKEVGVNCNRFSIQLISERNKKALKRLATR